MLELAHVVKRSREGLFDTVVFFDRKAEDVAETKRRIPGAIGIPGDFVKTVLRDDPVSDDELINSLTRKSDSEAELLSGQAALNAPESQLDTSETREFQVVLAQHRDFIRCFPFDIMNFDLEQFLFRPREDVPGRLVNALRKVFEWQRDIPLVWEGRKELIETFSFMFTTRLGPSQLPEVKEYMDMLSGYLEGNVSTYVSLRDAFEVRTGTTNVESYRKNNFEDYFCLSVPKVIAAIASDADWYVNPKQGFRMFKFERGLPGDPYTMVHVVAEMQRKNPSKNRRPPGDPGIGNRDETYVAVMQRLFNEKPEAVTEEISNAAILSPSLAEIIRRREGYMNGTMQS